MPRRLQFSLRTLLILSLLAGCGMWWWYGRYARWAAQLMDPAKREAALVALLEAQRTRDASDKDKLPQLDPAWRVRIDDVLESQQRSGPPLYLVFARRTLIASPNAQTTPIYCIDGQGYLLPRHSRILDSSVQFFKTSSNDPLHSISMIDLAEYMQLTVHSVELDPKLELKIILHQPERFYWHWGLVTDDRDKSLSIEVRPINAAGTNPPQVAYTWSQQERRFIGPDGGINQDILRLDTRVVDARLEDDIRSFLAQMKDLWTPNSGVPLSPTRHTLSPRDTLKRE